VSSKSSKPSRWHLYFKQRKKMIKLAKIFGKCKPAVYTVHTVHTYVHTVFYISLFVFVAQHKWWASHKTPRSQLGPQWHSAENSQNNMSSHFWQCRDCNLAARGPYLAATPSELVRRLVSRVGCGAPMKQCGGRAQERLDSTLVPRPQRWSQRILKGQYNKIF
jgi:hypothetical protein